MKQELKQNPANIEQSQHYFTTKHFLFFNKSWKQKRRYFE